MCDQRGFLVVLLFEWLPFSVVADSLCKQNVAEGEILVSTLVKIILIGRSN